MRHKLLHPEPEATCEHALALRGGGLLVLGVAVLFGAGLSGCSDEDDAEGPGGSFFNAGDDGDDTGGSRFGAGTTWQGAGNLWGGGAGSGGLSGEVCKHVDVAIAVDGSMSMTEELQAMRADIFPAFAQRLRTLGAWLDDFRVATLDACPRPSNFHTRGARRECDFAGGQPWIESSSSAMDEEFACVGDIYLDDQECSGDNDDEQPASALAAALEAGGANAGFQRRDALLIAIAITDEDEQPTGDERSPEEVYNRLVERAADDPRRLVFLGIGGGSECEGVYGDAEEAAELREITSLFEAHDRGVFWDLCEGRLEDGLDEAFRVIENACNDLCELDGDCGVGDPGDPPEGGDPLFCQDFPDDPSCRLD